MKKIIALLFLGFTMMISCKSKILERNVSINEKKEVNYIPYYLKVNEADSLSLVGDYKKSHHILDSLFKKFEPLNLSFCNEYIIYLSNKIRLNDFDEIDIVLKKAIQDFGLSVEYCANDSLIKIAMKKAKFTKQDLNGFYDNYIKSLNLEYRYAIEKMIENDQRVRLAVPRNNDEWEKVDTENAETIKLLLAKYGYPSVKKIGGYNFNNKSCNIKTLFLHASKEARESYILDLMLESVKKGECEPYDFAVVYDKYLMVTGKYGDKVLYGEMRNPKKSIDELVVNPKKIDSIRRSIGLEHLEYKYWKYKKLTGKDFDDL